MKKTTLKFNLGGLKINTEDAKAPQDEKSGQIGLLGSFGKTKIENEVKASSSRDVEAEKLLERQMGFSGFGKKVSTSEKASKLFNIAEMFEQSRRIAQERNKDNVEKRLQRKSSDDEDEDDEDFIGPPVPKQDEENASTKEVEKSKRSNDDDNESDEEEETLASKIPNSHEVELCHGHCAISALAIDPSGA